MSIKGKPRLDLAGQKFHFLTALRPGKQSASGNFYWWFRCDCGEETEVLPQNVKKIKNGIISCGCKQAERCHGKHWLTAKIYDYKIHARKLRLPYKLTKDYVEKLCTSPCYYCGSIIKIGIDRLNSDEGYIIENCVSCCKICNWMKRKMDYEEFIDHVKKICIVSSVA